MEKYSDAIFYVDNGLYFTKQDIDIIYNLKEPDAEWIYKNPDTYKKQRIIITVKKGCFIRWLFFTINRAKFGGQSIFEVVVALATK